MTSNRQVPDPSVGVGQVVGPVLVEGVLVDLLVEGLRVSVQALTLGDEPTHWSIPSTLGKKPCPLGT